MRPLPAEVEKDCPHPLAIPTGGDLEILAGRIGDALIECGAEKKIAVTAFNDMRSVVSGTP